MYRQSGTISPKKMWQESKDKSIQILKYNKTRKLFVLHPEFEKILTSDDVKDCSISIISIAGPLRQGKSFLLNFFLRYLYAEYVENDSENWMENNYVPLKGFKWQGGTKPETNGIWVWSKLFKKTLPNGDNVCVMLMDTEGVFGKGSNIKENNTVFSMSNLLSSVQIFNLSKQIREDDLQNLQLFSEFGQMTMDSNKPFQNLLFLVRDWCNRVAHNLGAKGGLKYLQKQLEIPATQEVQQSNVRNYLNSCYENLDCFLMANPGEKVDDSGFHKFIGDLNDIGDNFKENVKELVIKLLSPENILVKKIGGRKIIANEIFQYARTYLNNLNSNNINPLNIYEANIAVRVNIGIEKAIDYYISKMNLRVKKKDKYISRQAFKIIHDLIAESAISVYCTEVNRTAGNTDIPQKLQMKLNEEFAKFSSINKENKKFFQKVFGKLKDFCSDNFERIKLGLRITACVLTTTGIIVTTTLFVVALPFEAIACVIGFGVFAIVYFVTETANCFKNKKNKNL